MLKLLNLSANQKLVCLPAQRKKGRMGKVEKGSEEGEDRERKGGGGKVEKGREEAGKVKKGGGKVGNWR